MSDEFLKASSPNVKTSFSTVTSETSPKNGATLEAIRTPMTKTWRRLRRQNRQTQETSPGRWRRRRSRRGSQRDASSDSEPFYSGFVEESWQADLRKIDLWQRDRRKSFKSEVEAGTDSERMKRAKKIIVRIWMRCRISLWKEILFGVQYYDSKPFYWNHRKQRKQERKEIVLNLDGDRWDFLIRILT